MSDGREPGGTEIAEKRIHFVSLGCAKNQVDSEVMLGLLHQAGYRFASDAATADLIVVNTCAFIQEATEEAIETILELAALKETGLCQQLVVTGCLVQRYGEALLSLLPEVDTFVGTGEIRALAEILEGPAAGAERLHTGEPRFLYDHTTPRLRSAPSASAYVKLAEGCSNRCAYCVIPSVRGGLRSRDSESVIAEVRTLAGEGVREINLLAQDLTDFGRDRDETLALERLLGKLVAVHGVEWIRLLYCYPGKISDELITLMREEEKICRYLDLPVQHIEDSILGRMGRRGGSRAVRETLGRLREGVPGIALRTSLIVGFPGERESDFRSLLTFVEAERFERLGVFCYSTEEGTPAEGYPDPVPGPLREERRRILMEAQAAISLDHHTAMIGREVPVLVEGAAKETDHLLEGRTEQMAPEVDGSVYINRGAPPAGEICKVRITEAHPYDLIGEADEVGRGGGNG